MDDQVSQMQEEAQEIVDTELELLGLTLRLKAYENIMDPEEACKE
jgi:hypothetical protein